MQSEVRRVLAKLREQADDSFKRRLNDLKSRAERATTKDRWRQSGTGSDVVRDHDGRSVAAKFWSNGDAAYVAEADPVFIWALIERLEALESLVTQPCVAESCQKPTPAMIHATWCPDCIRADAEATDLPELPD